MRMNYHQVANNTGGSTVNGKNNGRPAGEKGRANSEKQASSS